MPNGGAMIDCPSCYGAGQYDVGDCEDGVTDICPECHGTGQIEEGDVFDSKRDAWRIGD